MERKKAFTLIELMATLAIFSILSVLISGILIQGNKLLTKTDNRVIIQNEIRTTLLTIQSQAKKANEIIINNKYGTFRNDKWILSDSENNARELLRFINDDGTAKVYVEINENNKHQLIEFMIYESTDVIVESSEKIMISNIEGSDVSSITINREEVKDSKGNKVNELVTINCSNIVSGNDINTNEYLISFTIDKRDTININGGGSEDSESGESEENNNNNELDNLVGIEFLEIATWYGGGQWQLNISNNTGKRIEGWSINFYSDNMIQPWSGWAEVEKLENGLTKIYSDKNSWNGNVEVNQTVEIKGNYTGDKKLEIKIIDIEYNN